MKKIFYYIGVLDIKFCFCDLSRWMKMKLNVIFIIKCIYIIIVLYID